MFSGGSWRIGRRRALKDERVGRDFWISEEVRRGPRTVCRKVGTGSEHPEL